MDFVDPMDLDDRLLRSDIAMDIDVTLYSVLGVLYTKAIIKLFLLRCQWIKLPLLSILMSVLLNSRSHQCNIDLAPNKVCIGIFSQIKNLHKYGNMESGVQCKTKSTNPTRSNAIHRSTQFAPSTGGFISLGERPTQWSQQGCQNIGSSIGSDRKATDESNPRACGSYGW